MFIEDTLGQCAHHGPGEGGCWIQVPGNRVPGNRVPGNRARLAVANDNMTTITFGRSTVTPKFVD